ncbi:U-box domain-containing protein 4-like isoform X2 [Curcuma longa]|uniref:U-box domain-containing protein 4-like isoform X2 n=1 Tax=Curcuma longa TaxID=136217 RepID=UPI003D9E569F
MEPSSLKALLHSVTEFGLVSSGGHVQLELVQRYCQKINHILENFKPVCNELVASEVSLDVQLVKALAELDAAIDEARGLVLSWHLMTSKIYFVLQMETIVTKIYSSMHDICQLVTSALPSPIDSMAVKCIKELQCMDEKQISVVIEKAIRDQSDNGSSSSEYLDMISYSLSLLSNEELLMEVVTLEKLKVKLGCSNTLIEIEDIDGFIALVTYMHDCYTKIHQVHTINGVSVPADFCCPLSLDLMSDPVIVASGQTYERAFIRKWLDQGINVCPRTHQTLGHTNLIPNYTVKALIANWCESNDIKLPDPLNSTSSNLPSFLNLTDVSTNDLIVSHTSHAINTNIPRAPESSGKATSHKDAHSSNGLTSQETCVSEKHVSPQHSSSSNVATLQMANGLETNHSGVSLEATETNNESNVELRNACSGSQIVGQSEQDLTDDNIEQPGDANLVSWVSSDLTHYSSDASGDFAQDSQASSAPQQEPKFPLGFVEARSRSQNMRRRSSIPHIHSSQSLDSRSDLSGVESEIRKLIEGLKSDSVDIQRNATGELRLLARHNMENRIVIANCGAISLLVGLLYSTDPQTQENAVTALLNLSINDNNKIAIGNANSIDPLIHVLETGNAEAKANAAATLYSLSVIEENKVRIGRSGAIAPLVELLANGTPRGKKDAATALFNLSIFHENKERIVQAGAVRYLVELMDPAAGMVDKAVAVLSNLATTPEGRTAIGQAGGITGLVEVVELGSARGKENAASALLHLCTNSSRYCSIVLQEGAVPPLVTLSQSGTPRAKEKAQTLLSYFRSQRHGNAGIN